MIESSNRIPEDTVAKIELIENSARNDSIFYKCSTKFSISENYKSEEIAENTECDTIDVNECEPDGFHVPGKVVEKPAWVRVRTKP